MSEPITSFADACAYLDGLQMHKIKLGLEAMRAALLPLGSPERACPAVHVAGTNGKGSVCAMLQAMLSRAGYRTGLYTSPHLSSIRERFRIDDAWISEDDFTRLMERVRASLAGRSITYFEAGTALAFLWFAERQCDVVILETGLGGRLDATNVVTPLLSVITAISLDHEQFLGTTIEEVAFEKAGIVKDEVPVVAAPADERAAAVIRATCAERMAPLCEQGRDYTMTAAGPGTWQWQAAADPSRRLELHLEHAAPWQGANAGCAVAAATLLREAGFELSDETIRAGAAGARWPGRMELIRTDRRYLLDGAHNRAAVDSLIEALKSYDYRRLLLVWAAMADKDYGAMLNDMAALADLVVLTRPDPERSAAPEAMRAELAPDIDAAIQCCPEVAAARRLADGAAGPEDLIVVAGSLYLVGRFRQLLVGEVVD